MSSIDFRLFRALVPGLLQRFCFVLRSGFLCLPTNFHLFRALVPGLLQSPSPDWFCFARRFPFLSGCHSFVPCSTSRPFPTGSRLFSAAISIEFTPTFFCSPRYISLCLLFDSCVISFHFSAHILLSNRSLPYVVEVLQTIGLKMEPDICLLSC